MNNDQPTYTSSHSHYKSTASPFRPTSPPLQFAVYLIHHEEADKIGRDPGLTERGIENAKQTKQDFPYQRMSVILCSPMRRALDTALILFDEAAITHARGIIAVPELQTAGNEIWNVGHTAQELRDRWNYNRKGVVLDWVVDGWNNKRSGKFSMNREKIHARVAEVHDYLLHLRRLAVRDMNVAVVSHRSMFAELLPSPVQGMRGYCGDPGLQRWVKCEYDFWDKLIIQA